MTEPETITAEVEEVMGQALEVSAAPPSTLFHTDDPAVVLAAATATAEVLAGVIEQKELYKVIGKKRHVFVEGWTMLGSMLGVFPIPEWTREIPDGWEARVVAKMRDGSEVGAAEAMCTRREAKWKNADDYAIRSMAQTRATSKALRLPLGFVVTLAGYEATPAEEMPEEASERRVEGGAGPTPVPRSWTKVRELVETFSGDSWIMFEAFVRAASYHLYGETESKKLTTDQRKIMLQKAAGAAVWLNDHPQTEALGTHASVDHFAKGWAHVLDGTVLEVPDYSPPENPGSDSVDDEANAIADEVFEAPQ